MVIMAVRLIVIAALLLFSPIASLTARVSAQEPAPSPYRSAIQRLIDEAYNQGEISVIDEIFAPTYIRYPANTDRTGIKTSHPGAAGRCPTCRPPRSCCLSREQRGAESLPSRISESDLVVSRQRTDPATHQPLEMVVNSLFVFNEQDTISVEWNAFDNLSFLANIGLMEQVAFWNAPDEPIEPAASSMTPYAKDLVLNHYDAMNRGDFAFIQARLRADFTGYNPFGSLDRDGYTADWRALYNALANFHITIEATTGEGDWIAAVYTLRGTFDRDFYLQDGSVVPPTGGGITLTIITFHQYDDQGQLRQTREIYDGWSLLSQIKLVSGRCPAK
jgi:hypothetical protein